MRRRIYKAEKQIVQDNNMKIYVDIDDTICYYDGDKKSYTKAIPNLESISKINKLYDQGNEITYWTARGNSSKINHFDLTKEQLASWGCKYHYLSVGDKPSYDLLICDKTKRIEEI